MAEYPEHYDFDLEYTELDAGYQARVLGSPAGDGAAVIFARPEIDPEDPAELSGARLFRTTFTGSVAEQFRQARSIARDHSARLRIRLQLAACPELVRLPWEFLYDDEESDFLALSGGTSVFRYVRMPASPQLTVAEPPLRVLMVASTAAIRPSRYLTDLTLAGLISVTDLAAPTFVELRDALVHGAFHVLDYAGVSAARLEDLRMLLRVSAASGWRSSAPTRRDRAIRIRRFSMPSARSPATASLPLSRGASRGGTLPEWSSPPRFTAV